MNENKTEFEHEFIAEFSPEEIAAIIDEAKQADEICARVCPVLLEAGLL